MHTVGARALQSVAAAAAAVATAAAPKPCRRRLVRPSSSRRPAWGAVRAFAGSAARPARPDDPGVTAHDNDDRRPENAAAGEAAAGSDGGSGGGGLDSDAAATSASSSASSGTGAGTSGGTTNGAAAAAAGSPPAEILKEAFSSTVGRGRSSRSRSQDGMPAVHLPDWFLRDRVRLYGRERAAAAAQPAGGPPPTTLAADLAAASALMVPATTAAQDADELAASPTPLERDALHQYFAAWLDGAAWDEHKVAQAAAHLRAGALDGQLGAVVARRGAAVAAAASYMAAALAWRPAPSDSLLFVSKLDPHDALDLPRRPFAKASRDAVQQRLAAARGGESPGPSAHAALARAADEAVAAEPAAASAAADAGEQLVFRELLATVATELRAVSPARPAKDLRRPVTVLTMLNYRGRSKAVAVVDDVARALGAHVVHLDAGSIADIAGPYLGQTAYWARGNMALLGYAAALKNGQLAQRYPNGAGGAGAGGDDDGDASASVVLSRLPVAFMRSSGLSAPSRLSMKAYPSESDERWDDLKINHVLEAMTRAADAAAAQEADGGAPAAEAREARETREAASVLVHVHNFLELSALAEGAQLLTKLRSIVDRLWHKGRRIVLVGSTSADFQRAAPGLLERAEELRQEDCHIIPYRVAEGPATRAMEARDTFHENLRNIRAMLSALTAAAWDGGRDGYGSRDGLDLFDSVSPELQAALSATVYDIHWVYRFAAQVLGGGDSRAPYAASTTSSAPPPPPSSSSSSSPAPLPLLDEDACLQALRAMRDQDQMWKDTAGAQEPYFSPLTVDRGADGAAAADAAREIRVGGVLRKVQPSDYSEYEKKFLSDLIDARDIRTTFADIVCPEEVKESLQTLTSLSLVRPEAFLYGVLAAERIPGCLLYGPPGTGKTLLAKAVAKQSGANMLEISAASINDMWVGNSEKNVQALFSLARKLAPVVIFLDEADALLGARQARPGRGGHRETINQFLREWDGLASNMRAFIMVATNRPFDLDEAVLRRLPRRILVDLPLRDARLAILRVLLRDEQLETAAAAADPVSLEQLAADTELYSGSDLKNLCVAAAMDAVREEVRAQAAHTQAGGVPDAFVFPPRRVLAGRHFARALQEIGASISEDMATLQAIRRFDERYGDNSSKRRRRGRRGLGFQVVPGPVQTQEALVRQAA